MLIERHGKCSLPSSTLHVWEAHMPCGGQMTAYANSFSLATLWALGMECRLLGLATSTCAWTHRNKAEGSSGRNRGEGQRRQEVLHKLMAYAKEVIKQHSILSLFILWRQSLYGMYLLLPWNSLYRPRWSASAGIKGMGHHVWSELQHLIDYLQGTMGKVSRKLTQTILAKQT